MVWLDLHDNMLESNCWVLYNNNVYRYRPNGSRCSKLFWDMDGNSIRVKKISPRPSVLERIGPPHLSYNEIIKKLNPLSKAEGKTENRPKDKDNPEIEPCISKVSSLAQIYQWFNYHDIPKNSEIYLIDADNSLNYIEVIYRKLYTNGIYAIVFLTKGFSPPKNFMNYFINVPNSFLVISENNNRNSADFLICYCLGMLSSQYPSLNYRIVTNDVSLGETLNNNHMINSKCIWINSYLYSQINVDPKHEIECIDFRYYFFMNWWLANKFFAKKYNLDCDLFDKWCYGNEYHDADMAVKRFSMHIQN